MAEEETRSNAMNGGSARRGTRRHRRGPTVADVARVAGVSPMTVSRVVNGDVRVLPDTRGKVSASITALGYVPNSAARSLAAGWQCRIALLHSNPSAAYLSEFLMGCLSQASTSNAQLVVEHCGPDEPVAELVKRIQLHRVDAVLLPPPLSDSIALLEALRAARLPLAQIATGNPVDYASAVTINDEAAAYAMTAHLLSLGHRRIGFISGDPNQTVSGLRHMGYERALREAGISPDPACMAGGDFTYRSGLAACKTLLALPERPTAIFASNDDMAAAAVAVAHRQHIDVPNDLSICGFDDTAMATTIWPELTTIRQPIADMARAAAELLIGSAYTLAQGGGANMRHVELVFELVRRGSTARLGSES